MAESKGPKVLVLFYSTYGHCYGLAKAIAEGVKEGGGIVTINQVKETLPPEVIQKMGATEAKKAFADIPVIKVSDVPNYDAIIFGSPVRFGLMAAQMKAFWDQTGGHWFTGKLIGKVASFFCTSATQHTQETTIITSMIPALHHGMVIVGIPASCKQIFGIDSMQGGSLYGSTSIVGGKGERFPSKIELEIAKFQGKHVTEITAKLCRK